MYVSTLVSCSIANYDAISCDMSAWPKLVCFAGLSAASEWTRGFEEGGLFELVLAVIAQDHVSQSH